MKQNCPLLSSHRNKQTFLCLMVALLTAQSTASLIRLSSQNNHLTQINQGLKQIANLQKTQDFVNKSNSRLLSIVNVTQNDSKTPTLIASLDSSTASTQNSTQSVTTSSNTTDKTAQNTPSTTNSTNTNSTPTNLTIYIVPNQLDYNLQGLISDDDKKVSLCNSSWAISAAYLYEYSLLKLGISDYISEQAIIRCTTYYVPQNKINNCSGGRFEDALLFLSFVGSVLKNNYPTSNIPVQQSSQAKICTEKNRVFVGEGKPVIISNLSDNSIKILLVENGPLLVNLYADINFIQYKSGTFDSCPLNAASQTNLTAVLFGYSGNEYWLIKGPFGKNWGSNGIMRLSMSNNCGLNSSIGYINYDVNNTNPNPYRVFDPTVKYYVKSVSPSVLSQKYLLYLNLCLLLMTILFL